MIITSEMQAYTDFDWFAVDEDGYILHFASGGGPIPDSVASSKHNLSKVLNHIHSLPVVSADYVLNKTFEEEKNFSSEQEKQKFLGSFIEMAEKGLYSFDKVGIGDFDNKQYHLVLSPTQPITLSDLPTETANILSKTRLKTSVANLETIYIDDFS